MGLFKKPEGTLFTEKVVKDYGKIGDNQRGIVRFRHRVVLSERGGQRKVIIQEIASGPLSFNTRYFKLDRNSKTY